jgi:hypothetical protein
MAYMSFDCRSSPKTLLAVTARPMITTLKITACDIKIFCFVFSSEVAKSIEVVTNDVMIPIKRRTAMIVLEASLGRVIVGQVDGDFTTTLVAVAAVAGILM